MDTDTAGYLAAVARHAHEEADLAAALSRKWQAWADQLADLADNHPGLVTLRDPDDLASYGPFEASAIPLHLGLLDTCRTADRLHRSRAEADAIAAALRRAERRLRHTAQVAETTTTDEEEAA